MFRKYLVPSIRYWWWRWQPAVLRLHPSRPRAADQDAEADLHADARLDADGGLSFRPSRPSSRRPTPIRPPTEVPPTETPVPEGAAERVAERQRTHRSQHRLSRDRPAGCRRFFVITGRNSAGDWLQFDFNGRSGWVTASLVTVTGAMESCRSRRGACLADCAPAAHRAAAPTSRRPHRPHRHRPVQIQDRSVDSCRPRRPAGPGSTATSGWEAPQSTREFAVFSWSARWPPPVASIQVGPHFGAVILGVGSWITSAISSTRRRACRRKGDWYVWIQDAGGARISEIAVFRSDGPVPEGTGCNDATIIFEG